MDHRLLLLLAILLLIPACRESEEGHSVSDDHKKVDGLVDPESGRLGLSDRVALGLENADDEVDEDTDLAIFLEQYSPTEGRKRLRRAFGKSADRVKLAQDLLYNYSGEDPARGANVLSMTMRQWSGEFASAIMGSQKMDPSMKEKMISIHSSVQSAQKNEKALSDMYAVLDPGGNRSRVAGHIASLSYQVGGGIRPALTTISGLDFQPEKDQAISFVLQQVHSQLAVEKFSSSSERPVGIAFTKDDRQLVEEFIKEWEQAGEIQDKLKMIALYQDSSEISPQDLFIREMLLSEELKEKLGKE